MTSFLGATLTGGQVRSPQKEKAELMFKNDTRAQLNTLQLLLNRQEKSLSASVCLWIFGANLNYEHIVCGDSDVSLLYNNITSVAM